MPEGLRDLTEFFLEWRDTCAIDLCSRKEDVAYVHKVFDGRFQSLVVEPRTSRLGDGVMAVSEYASDAKDVHAFHLVERYLYGKQKISGIPFKNHLFKSAGEGGSAGQINGYFLLTLRSIVNDSYKGSNVSMPRPNDDGGQCDPFDTVSDKDVAGGDFVSDDDPTLPLTLRECLDAFRSSLEAFWNGSGKDTRLALLCECFHIPKTSQAIVAASGLGKSAFYNRTPLHAIRQIADELADEHSPRDLRTVCTYHLVDIVEELGRTDPYCAPFFEVLESLPAKKAASKQ